MRSRGVHLGFVIVVGLGSVACGPRVSQWIQVTDCANRHVVVPGAGVFIHENFTGIPDTETGISVAGGKTDAQGNTWGSFPVERPTQVSAWVRSSTETHHPPTDVPANPQQPISVCVDKSR